MNVSDLIRIKRKELGLTLQELANKVGVTHVTIIRWERGDIQTLKNDKLPLLAKALGLSPLELLDGATEKETDILYKFRSLSVKDQQEILALIEFKLHNQ